MLTERIGGLVVTESLCTNRRIGCIVRRVRLDAGI